MEMSKQFLIHFTPEYVGIDTIALSKLAMKHYKALGLKSNEWIFYSLISYLNSEGKPYPHQTVLADMLGYSERQLKMIVASLKNKEMLAVKRVDGAFIYDFSPMFEKAYEIERELINQ